MNQEFFFEAIDAIHQTSPGLKAYLNVALKFVELKKNNALPDHFHDDFPIAFIEDGNLRTIIASKLNPEKDFIQFHFKGNILPRFYQQDNVNFMIKTFSIDSSKLITIPKKHLYSLHQHFPEFHLLVDFIREIPLNGMLHTSFDLANLDLAARLEKLSARKPDIFQIASINEIAKSLGTHPNSLSAIRNKKR